MTFQSTKNTSFLVVVIFLILVCGGRASLAASDGKSVMASEAAAERGGRGCELSRGSLTESLSRAPAVSLLSDTATAAATPTSQRRCPHIEQLVLLHINEGQLIPLLHRLPASRGISVARGAPVLAFNYA